MSLRSLAVLRSLEIPLWLCPGLACSLHSCRPPLAGWQRALGAWTPSHNPRLLSQHLFPRPHMVRAKQGSQASPSTQHLSRCHRWEKGDQTPGPWQSSSPPAGPVSHGADSCRGRIYLRILTTFSCPVPLWRQAAKEDAADKKWQQNQPGIRGLGKRHRAVEQTMESRGERGTEKR